MWLLSILISLTVLITLVLGLRSVENLESENRATEAQLHAIEMYDAALDERMKAMKRFRHDVNGLLQTIEYESKSRSTSCENSDDSEQIPSSSDRSLIETLLELMQAQCDDAGIAFSSSLDEGWRASVRERGIDEADVQSVVQNLLQNAYEASLVVFPESDRLIRFYMRNCAGRLHIEVTNRIASDEMPAFETTKPSPDQHGIGLKVVEDIVVSCGGGKDVSFDSKTRLLTIRAVL